MAQIKVPQAFVYMAKIPATKKIKNIVFRHGVPVTVHDPKIVRLLALLPYMKTAEMQEQPEVVAAPKQATTEITADWRKAHHKRRMAWARQITGGEVTTATEANRIIAAHRGEPDVEPVAVAQAEAA